MENGQGMDFPVIIEKLRSEGAEGRKQSFAELNELWNVLFIAVEGAFNEDPRVQKVILKVRYGFNFSNKERAINLKKPHRR